MSAAAGAEDVVRARAPGRVNLIGDHTDYTGGLVFPMAVDRYTEIELERGLPWIELVSADEPEPAIIHLESPVEPATIRPTWARYVAAVATLLQAERGGRGFVRTTLPIGAGLSSSAALEVAAALALGFDGPAIDLALLCQRAEQLACGVPCGVMDQLTSAAAVDGHALLIDCRALRIEHVPLPSELQVLVIDSGQRRTLSTTFYGVRRAQCDDAEALIGPLRDASPSDVDGIAHDDLRRRARHVVTENARVLAFADALRAHDHEAAGALMFESHASLRDDFEVSTTTLDELVERLAATPGVFGARLTGAGFGGCVVALTEPGVTLELGTPSWRVQPSPGASVVSVATG